MDPALAGFLMGLHSREGLHGGATAGALVETAVVTERVKSNVGDTRGFARRGASYQRHGRPKAVFVYPLQRHARDRLRALDSPHESRKPEGTQLVKLDIRTGSPPGTTSPMG